MGVEVLLLRIYLPVLPNYQNPKGHQLRVVFLNFLRRAPLICVRCTSQNVFTLLGRSLHYPVVIYEFPYGHLHPLLRCDSP